MKKALMVILGACFTAGLLSSCAVTSDKYRYQQRVDRWYNVLNTEEKADFRANRMKELGVSLEARLAKDVKLAKDYRTMREYEAITAFDADQTARFFREIILRELNRPNFFKLMDRLDGPSQLAFAYSYAAAATNTNGLPEAFAKKMESLHASDSRFRGLIDSLKYEYRLYDFSTLEVLNFFRTVSFAEISRKNLYDVLKFLKNNGALQPFLAGRLDEAAAVIVAQQKKLVTSAMQFANLQRSTALNHLDEKGFLEVYFAVVLKEMDPGAVAKTVSKFQ